ncbi:hypothetical protein Taro_048217 [Colocasia esculenta]|uniref:Uncharacterized protein n=1 Tax=Colocasia esculenta TaxID=4460 RepID=A0A843X7Q9_COLES|nr:hypothetical protein [Colocasia esculenta]
MHAPSQSGQATAPRLAPLCGSGANAERGSEKKDCLSHARKKTPQRPRRPTLDKRALQMTRRCCPNLIFPSAPESANSAANSSTLVARSTPSTGFRGWGSQAIETTSERGKPSSAKHWANRRSKHNKNHPELLACNSRQAQQARGTHGPSRGPSANQGMHKKARTSAAHKPHAHHTGEGSMEKLSKLTRKHEKLPIHLDREEHKQSLP